MHPGHIILEGGFLIQILLQLGCAVQAYRIYKKINHGNRWWIISGAFILMAVRRVTAMVTASGADLTFLQLADKLTLPLTISILLFIGLTFLNQSTERYVTDNMRKLEELAKRLTI